MAPPESLPLTINFDDLKKPNNSFLVKLYGPNSDRTQISIPFNLKRKAIDNMSFIGQSKGRANSAKGGNV